MKHQSVLLFAVTFSLLSIGFSSCTSMDTFEKNVQIPGHEWSYSNQPEINFTITDTISPYNVFVTLRHTDAYSYKNIWLFISTRQPGDSSFQKERFELTLQNQNGEWIGTGMNDIWEVRYPLFSNIRFTKQGSYSIRLQQTMRDNPLLHIMNAGIRIEKAN
ncbi:MAG: gliding motility lipoprotein GldH [Chitinophagaceae bacterium]|nr:gliding motility lipoprotein GldH [Chitinophagaceae bacterium]